MAEDEDYPSSSDVEEDDCYITDQEDAIEENVLQGLEDGREEDCHWSLSSVSSPFYSSPTPDWFLVPPRVSAISNRDGVVGAERAAREDPVDSLPLGCRENL
ncbi:hypothetical protein GW17_00030798 [Ensete ventricosum]|nr:hypothetical protein GW17_00030798 [Ensete ventricosum]